MEISSSHQKQPLEDDHSPRIIFSSSPHQTQMQECFNPSSVNLKQKGRSKPAIIELHKGRVIRSTGRKDRHSKVSTAKGPKDRRVRLSPNTAIRFYDVQDRLGCDRPSKAIDWLMKEAKAAIDALDDHKSQKNISENRTQISLENVTVQTMNRCNDSENHISRLGCDDQTLLLTDDVQVFPDVGFDPTRSYRNEALEVLNPMLYHCAATHEGQLGFVATPQTCDTALEIDRLQRIFNWAHKSYSFVDSVPLHNLPADDHLPVLGYNHQLCNDIREPLQSSNSCHYNYSQGINQFPGISFSNEDMLTMNYNNADDGVFTKEDGSV